LTSKPPAGFSSGGRDGSMQRYLFQRLILVIPVLFIVSVVIFSIVHLTPGDAAYSILGDEASQPKIEELRERLGLNLAPIVQYTRWISNVVRGNLGVSFLRDYPVIDLIKLHIKPTLSLTLYSMAISISIALALGILSAKMQGTVFDHGITTFTMFGISVPGFLLGLGLMYLFAVYLRWFPVASYKDISAGLGPHLRSITLPAVSLGMMHYALIMRMTRTTVIEILNSDFIMLAKAKGVSEFAIFVKHALRNAMIPIITVIGQSFISALSGAAVIESMFGVPGMGQLIVNSINRRDYLVIQGVVLFITLLNVVISLIVDLLYCVLDPRIRLSH
jgi:peptide/nickel transport system permease protein